MLHRVTQIRSSLITNLELPMWLNGLRICLQHRRCRFNPWVGKIPWRRVLQPTPVFLPGKSHGQRSLAGCSPWSHKGSEATEWLNMHSHSHKSALATQFGVSVTFSLGLRAWKQFCVCTWPLPVNSCTNFVCLSFSLSRKWVSVFEASPQFPKWILYRLHSVS